MNLLYPMNERRCKATNRQGEQCGRAPIAGGAVCWYHGGAAPQVQAKAAERLAALVDPAIDRLADLLTTNDEQVALKAAIDVLNRNGLKVAEKHEVTGADGAPLIPAIQVTFVKPDDSGVSE
jgi:hypothetical protein